MGRNRSTFAGQTWRTLLTAAAMVTFATATNAETRVALVIGNANYQHAPHLANPEHDADVIAAALKHAGFTVDERKNLSQEGMKSAILSFSETARESDVAIVYYAGHGIQRDGVDYLIPVDAALKTPASLPFETVQADLVLGVVAQARRLRLLILDACRDDPFIAQLASMGTRGISRGLAPVVAANDTITAYSAKDNTEALDGNGANSPYATALAKRIVEPNTELDKMFREVRDDVMADTGGQQEPFVYGSRGGGDFYFMPGGTVVNTTMQMPAAPDPEAMDFAAWEAVKDSNDPSVLHSYLDQYPNGAFAGIARAKIAALGKASQPAPPTEEASLSPQSQPRPSSGTGGCLVASTARVGCTFRDCADVCPEMVTLPPGSYIMGSPANEPYHSTAEEPDHSVSISYFLAVGKFPVTFEQWDACVAANGCNGYRPDDDGWGRGNRPVINVSWNDTQAYLRWLSQKSGHSYRLLSDSEYEYATRAGTTTAYYWGSEIGSGKANCDSCRSQWDDKQTSPVGSFPSNRFGLYDMVGNIWEWTEDCWSNDYDGLPSDGSAWYGGDCDLRVQRGGFYGDNPYTLRSAYRSRDGVLKRGAGGFRVARTF